MMNKFKWIVGLSLGVIVCLLLSGLFGKIQLGTDNSQLLQEMDLKLGRAATQIVSQQKIELEAQKQLSLGLLEELGRTRARVESLQSVVARLRTTGGGKLVPVVSPSPPDDPSVALPANQDHFKFEDYHLRLDIDISSQIVSYELFQRFRANLVTTVNSDDTQSNYVEIWEIAPSGDVKLELEDFHVLITEPPEKFWIPLANLDMGLEVGYSGSMYLFPTVGISLAGWGKGEHVQKYRFARLSISSNLQKLHLSFSPVAVNLDFLPLISNTYLTGPVIGVSIPKLNLVLGIGIIVRL